MNLKELAAELHLSQTTVSRALNGYPEVSEKTRQKVLAAAQRFGYRPSPAARRLATGRAHALGVVFNAERNLLMDPLFVEYLAGVAETSAKQGFDILISPSTPHDEIATYSRLASDGTVVATTDIVANGLDPAWTNVSVDISSYADNGSHEIRFTYVTSTTSDGNVFIDDVTIDEQAGSSVIRPR